MIFTFNDHLDIYLVGSFLFAGLCYKSVKWIKKPKDTKNTKLKKPIIELCDTLYDVITVLRLEHKNKRTNCKENIIEDEKLIKKIIEIQNNINILKRAIVEISKKNL